MAMPIALVLVANVPCTPPSLRLRIPINKFAITIRLLSSSFYSIQTDQLKATIANSIASKQAGKKVYAQSIRRCHSDALLIKQIPSCEFVWFFFVASLARCLFVCVVYYELIISVK